MWMSNCIKLSRLKDAMHEYCRVISGFCRVISSFDSVFDLVSLVPQPTSLEADRDLHQVLEHGAPASTREPADVFRQKMQFEKY